MLSYFLAHFGLWGSYFLSATFHKKGLKLQYLPTILLYSAIGAAFSSLAHYHIYHIHFKPADLLELTK